MSKLVFGHGLWGFSSSGLNTRGGAACSCCFSSGNVTQLVLFMVQLRDQRRVSHQGEGRPTTRPRSSDTEDRFWLAEYRQQSGFQKKPGAGRRLKLPPSECLGTRRQPLQSRAFPWHLSPQHGSSFLFGSRASFPLQQALEASLRQSA